MMLFFRTYTCIFITLNSFLWQWCLYSLQRPYSVTGVSKTQLPCINLLPWQGCLNSTYTLFIWHTHTTWHCFQIALLWHCSGPTDCPIAQGLVLILSMLLLFVNFNMMSFFRTHTWTLVYPGVSIPYNNLNLSQGCLKLNCLRSTFFDDRGVYNSSGTIHTGLNTRRALREMFT